MKLEKRSSGAEQAPAADSQETTPKGKKPVVVYIMILFIVAFLLMALSFMMHQRSNSEVLGELQDSVSAMQEIQVEGLTGTMTWDAAGTVTKTPTAVVIKDGAYVSAE